MHEYDKLYSIKKGPYDEGLINLNFLKNILYNNHLNHHLQKGDKKGNYNVIVLGADEWFNKYNITYDNYLYCLEEKNKNEKICKYIS
jgi:hypothetical protein